MTDRHTTRRRILEAAGSVGIAAVAGCLSVRGGSGTPTTETGDDDEPGAMSGEGTTTPGETPPDRRVTGVEVSEADLSGFSVSAAVKHPNITPDRTAEIEYTLTRRGPTVTLFAGPARVLNCRNFSDPPGIQLLIREDVPRQNRTTWLPESDEYTACPSEATATVLTEGESITESYSLWGDPGYATSIEPGTYQFSNNLAWKDGEGRSSGSDNENVRWNHTISVETVGDS
jgi:hypothetical protein